MDSVFRTVYREQRLKKGGSRPGSGKSALYDEPPKKNKDLEHPEHFHEVHDPFLFSAPPFTAPRKHARVSSVLPVTTAAHERLRFARACMICDLPALLPVM
jgi:hypothetical protein